MLILRLCCTLWKPVPDVSYLAVFPIKVQAYAQALHASSNCLTGERGALANCHKSCLQGCSHMGRTQVAWRKTPGCRGVLILETCAIELFLFGFIKTTFRTIIGIFCKGCWSCTQCGWFIWQVGMANASWMVKQAFESCSVQPAIVVSSQSAGLAAT